MLHRKGLAHGATGVRFDPLAPQAVIAISAGSIVKRLPIRRPVSVILGPNVPNGDPRRLRNGPLPIEPRYHDAPPSRLNPCSKANPALIWRELTIQQTPGGMCNQRGPLTRSNIEKVDSIRVAAEYQHAL